MAKSKQKGFVFFITYLFPYLKSFVNTRSKYFASIYFLKDPKLILNLTEERFWSSSLIPPLQPPTTLSLVFLSGEDHAGDHKQATQSHPDGGSATVALQVSWTVDKGTVTTKPPIESAISYFERFSIEEVFSIRLRLWREQSDCLTLLPQLWSP